MSRADAALMADLASRLLQPVLAAGAAELRHYRAGVSVEQKADQSPVTAADREAEEILLAALAEIAPEIPIVAEEAVSEGRVPEIADRFFLVDPLDGTREFIHRRGEFTVNVALIDAGRPIFGIVLAPALDDLYVTLAADRAVRIRVSCDEAARNRLHLGSYPAEVLRTRQPDFTALRAVASRSHLTPETEQFLGLYPVSSRSDYGSSLKFCAIARGEADIYPRLAPTMEWDTAAGHAVLLAAGGSVTQPDGTPLNYGNSAAGYRNPHFVAWATPMPISAAMD